MRQSSSFVSENFLQPQKNSSLSKSRTTVPNSGDPCYNTNLFKIFNLKTNTYKEASLRDIRALSRHVRFRSESTLYSNIGSYQPEYAIVAYSLTEEVLQSLMTFYQINPILYQEICQRQVFDKALVLNEDSHYYNLIMHQEYSHKDQSLIKMIEMKNHRTLLILTD